MVTDVYTFSRNVACASGYTFPQMHCSKAAFYAHLLRNQMNTVWVNEIVVIDIKFITLKISLLYFLGGPE